MLFSWPQDPSLDDELPEYLAARARPGARDRPRRGDLRLGAHRLAAALTDSRGWEGKLPSWPRPASVSGAFSRLVVLPGPHLAAMLEEWWSAGAKDGTVTVDRRLRLGPPDGQPGAGWTMHGWFRRLTRWHWVPVVVELWPVHDCWTMMTMTPQVRVIASERYFRTGHSVLERLTADLDKTLGS